MGSQQGPLLELADLDEQALFEIMRKLAPKVGPLASRPPALPPPRPLSPPAPLALAHAPVPPLRALSATGHRGPLLRLPAMAV